MAAVGVLILAVVLALPDIERPPQEGEMFAMRAAEIRQGLGGVLKTSAIQARIRIGGSRQGVDLRQSLA